MTKNKTRAIGVDFDCTLAYYEEGDLDKHGPEFTGKPIAEMVKKVKKELAKGTEVYIFTARVNPGGEFAQAMRATKSYLVIVEWCKKHLGQIVPVTHEKSWTWDEIWDDRAHQVIPNTGVFITELVEAAK